jgi:hypothetical protein
MTPIIIISGGAGSGKDTVAEMLCKGRNGALIAQADPLKQFAQQVAGFTSDQLWGPSSSRNAEDPRFAPGIEGEVNWELMAEQVLFSDLAPAWLTHIGAPNGFPALSAWFNQLRADFKNRTLTPRAFLQTLGTEFGRTLHRDIWSNLAVNTARELLIGGVSYDRETGLRADPTNPGHNFVVITDGRFRNEIFNVASIGGRALKIQNPSDESSVVEKAGIEGHASEAQIKGIPDSWYSYRLTNDKKLGLDFLREEINHLALIWELKA